jgi:hypothetical protein
MRENEIDYGHSIKVGVTLGFIVGALLGIGLVVYIDSPALYAWPGMISLPIVNAFGWAFYGLIVGGSGLFSEVKWNRQGASREHRTRATA